MKTRFLLLTALAFLLVQPIKAQLRTPFRSESATIRYVQFPLSEQKYRDVEVEVKQKALLGEAVAGATERVTGAAARFGVQIEDQTGTTSDKSSPKFTVNLIPEVFPADGKLYLEVLFYEEVKIKEDGIKTKFLNGADLEVKVEYNLYSMPEKTLVDSQGPFWVAGASTTKTSGPNQSREDRYKDRENIARQWARAEMLRKYSMRRASSGIEVYTIRALSGEEDNIQKSAQEKFIPLVSAFRTEQGTEEYKNGVKECITMWEGLLKKYEPGAKRRDADINDNNVFVLYYNLATANYLIGNEKKANEYVKKGIEVTKIQWEDVTNRSGEVIGRKRSGIMHIHEDIFHNLRDDMNAYYKGIEAHNPVFVALVTNDANMRKMGRTVRALAVNLNLSQIVGLDYPVEIVDVRTKETPKQILGEITKEGNHVSNYRIKKVLIGKGYKVNLTNNEGSLKSKLSLNDAMLPTTEYDFVLYTGRNSFVGLPVSIVLGKLKNETGRAVMDRARISYDWDGNIAITNRMFQDRWFYLNYVKASADDALKTITTSTVIKFNKEGDINSYEMEISNIERDRELGFVGFFKNVNAKWLRGLYDFTEKSNDSYNLVFENVHDLDVIEKDNKENWTKLRSGEVELTRSMDY